MPPEATALAADPKVFPRISAQFNQRPDSVLAQLYVFRDEDILGVNAGLKVQHLPE
jgi:hypothetical protein